MSDRLEPFETLWTRGLESLDGKPHHQTLRSALRQTGSHTLPHLTMSATTASSESSDFIVRSTLGEGGMGVVYLVRQQSLNREVAVKQVRKDAPAGATDALVREAQLMGGLEHPQIIPVHALGMDEEGVPSLVMKKVSGVSWTTLIEQPDHDGWRDEETPPLVRHIEILIDVCKAVHFAHSRQVLHRDLKPDNIMIGSFGEVYVLDWGIAMRFDHPANEEGVYGTPSYMAPEMLDSRAPLGPVTDVYLLGACLHEVLTGEPRHTGATMKAILRSIYASKEVSYPATIPSMLAAIANRACHADPDQRYPTALDLQRALAQWLRNRHAAELTATAHQRLAQLKELISREKLDSAERADAHELFTECRFAFRQAIEFGDDIARNGLLEAMRVMIPFELALMNIDTAAGLLRELQQQGESDLESLQRLLDQAIEKRSHAVQLAYDNDLEIGRGGRIAGAALFVVVLLAVACTGRFLLHGQEHVGAREAFGIGVLILGMAILGVLMLRRFLLANAVNRSITLVFLGSVTCVVVGRAMAWRFGVPLESLIAADLVIELAGTLAATAISRRFAVAVVFPLVGLVVLACWPGIALLVFATTSVLVVLASAWSMRRVSP